MRTFLLFASMLFFGFGIHAQTTINSSVSITQVDIDGYSWPVTINGGSQSNPTVVALAEDILLYGPEHFFIVESEYVEFNGNNYIVSLDYIDDYPGLLQNGTSSLNAYDFVTVSNVHIASNNTTLSNNGGWIGQTYFGVGASTVTFNYCSSNGSISYAGGGITGQYSKANTNYCHSTGNMGDAAGGIYGEGSDGLATHCYSNGTIGNSGGGIFGNVSSGSADFCYSTGTINQSSGGILGNGPMGTATNCYSTGNIAMHGGGIIGAGGAGAVVKSYSTGNMDVNAGGIVGAYNSGSVSNCYSLGTIATGAGGISGFNFYGTSSNSYFTSGNAWSDNDANNVLLGVGTDWTVMGSNVPYRLSAFNEILYSPDNASISENTSSSFYAGNLSTGTYSIIDANGDFSVHPSLTINAGSGLISVNNSVAGTYDIKVLYTDASNGSYQINNFTLNVLSTLPATWQSFTVTARGNDAWLQWSTSAEQNTRHFNVQYSIDGRTWITVATIAAAGNSTSTSNYSFLHPDRANSNNYYRIQQTDRDGHYSYTVVRQLHAATENKDFRVLNTLVNNGILMVEVRASSTLYLYNSEGKLMWQIKPGIGVEHIDISGVSKGVYFLKGNELVEKIVVR